MEKSKVAVTGGSGYIASWLVKLLLEDGYTVHATVRDKNKTEKYQHLLAIADKAVGSLHVFEADLTKEGSFKQAFEGVNYVFHTASPFFLFEEKEADKRLLKPAIDGTKNVLKSVNETHTVERVILTSSYVAMVGDIIDLKDRQFKIDDSCWNTSSQATYTCYAYSKTIAEKAAWKMVKDQDRWDLVTIHPGFVLGPSITKRVDSFSIKTMLDLLHGVYKSGTPEYNFLISDVRDIAKGHMLAAFTKEAHGRYLIADASGNFLTMGQHIEAAYPGRFKLPQKFIPKWLYALIAPMTGTSRKFVKANIGYPIRGDSGKSKEELGMVYRPLRATLADQVKQLDTDGLI